MQTKSLFGRILLAARYLPGASWFGVKAPALNDTKAAAGSDTVKTGGQARPEVSDEGECDGQCGGGNVEDEELMNEEQMKEERWKKPAADVTKERSKADQSKPRNEKKTDQSKGTRQQTAKKESGKDELDTGCCPAEAEKETVTSEKNTEASQQQEEKRAGEVTTTLGENKECPLIQIILG